MKDERSLIKMQEFLRVLAKFRLKLNDKQKSIIQKLYRVLYVEDQSMISIQPILDMEKSLSTNQIFNKVKLEESNEELKMDLGGFLGDFHRHRVSHEAIKKRRAFTETELVDMMIVDDRLKEIALAFR